MSELKWVDQPAIIRMDSPATELTAAVQRSQAVLLYYAQSRYYGYLTADLRIKPWYAKLRLLLSGTVADYVDLAGETPVVLIRVGQKQPADFRCLVETDSTGSPLRAAFHMAHPPTVWDSFDFKPARAFHIPPPPAGTASITRYPVIQTSAIVAGIEVDFTIDLPSVPPDGVADPDLLTISGLPADWQKAEIVAEIVSAHLHFPESTGTIVLHRDGTSVACTIHGKVDATCIPGQTISVIVTFLIQDRLCGFIRRTFTIGQAPSQTPGDPFGFDFNATAPVLTVSIFQIDKGRPGRLQWSVLLSRGLEIPGMPQELNGIVDLGDNPAGFVRALYDTFPQLTPLNHVQTFLGFGEKLWRQAPVFFQQAYWAMRKCLGVEFAIQFISTDPNIPWELMRPISLNDNDDDNVITGLLAMTHPVARSVGDSYGSLRYHLPAGNIATIAPRYVAANDRLPRAQEETKMLQERYSAMSVAGTHEGVWNLLTKGLDAGPVSIVHFAGHCNFPLDTAALSSLMLQDSNLTVLEVDTQEVKLGKKTGCLVVFNACEAGSTGSLLGGVGGWAQTILHQRFGGFIAPLWAVGDEDAAVVAAELFDALVNRRLPVSQALLSIRKRYGGSSPAYLAYLFYGDVGARIGPAFIA